MKVVSMNVVNPTRIEICERLLKESDNIKELMDAIQEFSKRVIKTETARTAAEQLQGEVMNDPDNLRMKATQMYHRICFLSKRVETQNHFLEMSDDVALEIAHLIDECEHLTFDPTMFGIDPKELEGANPEEYAEADTDECKGCCGCECGEEDDIEIEDKDIEAFSHFMSLMDYITEEVEERMK